jgi:hypothetical protein
MKDFKWLVIVGSILLFLSALLYFAHYLVFRDTHHIFIYLMGDVAFVPIEVLLVTLIIHRLLAHKEKQHRLEKTNMVVEVFYSEMGSMLLSVFSNLDHGSENIRSALERIDDWTNKNIKTIKEVLVNHQYEVDARKIDLVHLTSILTDKRGFLINLWGNPILLEDESFTEVLRSVMHLTEELSSREGIEKIPEADYDHLSGDIKRAYSLLAVQWLDYMKHLKDNYPYFFSLAIRTNPFDKNASPLIT